MKFFTKSIFYKAVFLSFMFTLTACGGSSSDDTTETADATDTSGTTDTTNTTNTTDATDRLDIKDAIFTNTSADCADYDNSYEADVADVQEATDFVLDVVITSTDSDCIISSNNIPNHDFNTTGNFATVAREVSQEFIIERSPMLADSTTALSQQQYDVVMLNGVPLDILSAGCYENGEDVPFGCTTDDDWLLDPLELMGRLAQMNTTLILNQQVFTIIMVRQKRCLILKMIQPLLLLLGLPQMVSQFMACILLTQTAPSEKQHQVMH